MRTVVALIFVALAAAWAETALARAGVVADRAVAVVGIDGQPLNLDDTRLVIVAGAKHAGWEAKEQGLGKIRLELRLGGRWAFMEVDYAAGSYVMRYAGSDGFGASEQSDKSIRAHGSFVGRINKLVDAIAAAGKGKGAASSPGDLVTPAPAPARSSPVKLDDLPLPATAK